MKDSNISEAGPPGSALPAWRQTNPPRILVVEDDVAARNLSAETLANAGYQVDTAEDGGAAWEALQASHYNLLITDNTMPKISGLELVKMVRSARMTLPVVMASGSIPTEALNRDSTLQLAATLVKPFTMQELVGTVEGIVRATEVAASHTVSFPARAVAG
jgi:DNA-binding response OmpR family regulator